MPVGLRDRARIALMVFSFTQIGAALTMPCHHTLEAYMHAYLEGIGLAAEPKLDLILQRTAALGMHGKVTISHGFCLGDLAERERDALLARMAELRVAIVTTAPAAVPVPSVAACRAAGVTVIGGNDGVRDTWTPFGSPDMLERAMLIAMRNDFRRDDALEVALDCVTHGGARGCGFVDYGLEAGKRADVVLVDAATFAEAVVARPLRRLVVSSGKIVARDGVLL